jgi:hypothetical protein
MELNVSVRIELEVEVALVGVAVQPIEIGLPTILRVP